MYNSDNVRACVRACVCVCVWFTAFFSLFSSSFLFSARLTGFQSFRQCVSMSLLVFARRIKCLHCSEPAFTATDNYSRPEFGEGLLGDGIDMQHIGPSAPRLGVIPAWLDFTWHVIWPSGPQLVRWIIRRKIRQVLEKVTVFLCAHAQVVLFLGRWRVIRKAFPCFPAALFFPCRFFCCWRSVLVALVCAVSSGGERKPAVGFLLWLGFLSGMFLLKFENSFLSSSRFFLLPSCNILCYVIYI